MKHIFTVKLLSMKLFESLVEYNTEEIIETITKET